MRVVSIMSSVLRLPERRNDYPTSDGKPMGETDWHRKLMNILIETLEAFFAGQRVYVSGNLLLFYEPGNRRRHVSPDVFVVRGVDNHLRDNYLLWEERRGPQVVIEVTSASTAQEDQTTKRALYRDTLGVREYFLFDPYGEWLDPPLQGFRLRKGMYQPIRSRHGRLVSSVLKLHLEGDGEMLRLWDPRTGKWLPTPAERLEQEAQARAESEAESERLRRENEELRRRLGETE
jgi:Uma2 family endonuclease